MRKMTEKERIIDHAKWRVEDWLKHAQLWQGLAAQSTPGSQPYQKALERAEDRLAAACYLDDCIQHRQYGAIASILGIPYIGVERSGS